MIFSFALPILRPAEADVEAETPMVLEIICAIVAIFCKYAEMPRWIEGHTRVAAPTELSHRTDGCYASTRVVAQSQLSSGININDIKRGVDDGGEQMRLGLGVVELEKHVFVGCDILTSERCAGSNLKPVVKAIVQPKRRVKRETRPRGIAFVWFRYSQIDADLVADEGEPFWFSFLREGHARQKQEGQQMESFCHDNYGLLIIG